MTFETACALNHAYGIFASHEDSYGLARRSGVTDSLQNLTADDWDIMNRKFDLQVMLYDHDSLLLRHFLPRILEWVIEDSSSEARFYWLDLWSLSHRLNHARWLQWPAEEVEAARGVFEAWTREELSQREGQPPLFFLFEVEDDLSRYLDIWLELRLLEVAHWLWTVDWNKHENVRRWATQPRVEAALEGAFFADIDSPDAALLSRSVELVRSLRAEEEI